MIAGVDYDSFGVFVALVDFDGRLRDLVTVRYRDKSREAAADLAFPAALRIPGELARALAGPRRRPSLAFVERGLAPPGQQKHLFTMGRAQGLVVAGLLELGVLVNELRPAEWKAELTGKGNASKGEAHRALAAIFPGDPRLGDENMRDALAIAYTGAKMNLEASR